jgi:hypothetical protein
MSADASTRICVAPLLVAAASLAAAPLRGAGASGYCCSAVQVRHVPFYGGSICVYAQKSTGLPAPRVPSPFTHWRTRWAGAYSPGLVALQGGMRSTRRFRQRSRMRQPRGSRGANSSGSFHARQALQRAAATDRAALQLGVFFGGRGIRLCCGRHARHSVHTAQVVDQRVALLEVLSKLKADGSSIVGYGASGRTVRARQGHVQHFSGLRCAAALRMRTPPSNKWVHRNGSQKPSCACEHAQCMG